MFRVLVGVIVVAGQTLACERFIFSQQIAGTAELRQTKPRQIRFATIDGFFILKATTKDEIEKLNVEAPNERTRFDELFDTSTNDVPSACMRPQKFRRAYFDYSADPKKKSLEQRQSAIYAKAYAALQREVGDYCKVNGIDFVIEKTPDPCSASPNLLTPENVVALCNRKVLSATPEIDITSHILKRLKPQPEAPQDSEHRR